MKANRTLAIVLVIVCAAVTGKAQPRNGSAPMFRMAAAQKADTELEAKDLVLVDAEDTAVGKRLAKTIGDLMAAKDYDGLDKLAADLRKSKEQTADGTWHLLQFYGVMGFGQPYSDRPTEAMWTARRSFLKSWVEAKPTSITARISLARFLKQHAWEARGGGDARTVSDQGWKLFRDRLDLARQTLVDARKLEEKCPVWWDTMHFVALGKGVDLAGYDKMFNEAVAFDPGYTFFYNNKVTYLLPRWFGAEGDWQKFAQEAADKVGGEQGDILYARLGWRAHERKYYAGFLKDSGYSWPRMKKGLEALVKQHPESLSAASELAYLAYQKKDRGCAKPLFERLGSKVDLGVWGNDKPRFMRARAWALSE